MIDFDNGDQWDEEEYDYGNAYGVAYGKIFGFRKAKFMDKVSSKVQDFGVIALDMAI